MSEGARTALVTGAAGGIGRAVARRLRASGWAVLGSDLVAQPEDLAVDDWIVADIAAAQGRAAIATHVARPLAGFVHCAGLFHTGALGEIDEAAWDRVFDVNAKAPLLLFQGIAGRLAPGAAAVFVASAAALRGTPDHLLYAASKAALRNLSASLALALVARNIRVNCVCPGLIDTKMTDAANLALSARRDLPVAAVAAERAASVPAGRAGTPDEVADTVAFLLSDQASYITGSTITVAGGALAGVV
jgi:NAD(P)-dependent dehydrogenase (short-subunit alcohol dehydrogenase family)